MASKSTFSAVALLLQLTSARFLNTTRPAVASVGSFSIHSSEVPHRPSIETPHRPSPVIPHTTFTSSSHIPHSHTSSSSNSEVTITANSTYVPPRFHKFDYVSCSFESSADDGDTCDNFSAEWGLTVAQFESLNPGVDCPTLVGGQSYCVIGTVETGTPTGPTTTSTTTTPTKTTPKMTTTTTAAQHQPQQSGLAANCNNFYLVQGGDSCDAIDMKYGISFAQFESWNPSINSDCTNLLSGYYVCVGVPGATTTPPTKTTTKPGNGISTPTPTQDGMVSNCNKFDEVNSGDTCANIATANNIPLAKFYSWNPAVGSDCHALWAGYYVCVDTTDYTPTKTTPGNGITTPTPYEQGMVTNCDKFYKVKSGDTCDAIAKSQGTTTQNIEKWNPNVGSDCSKLYLGYYICTGVK